MPPHPQVQTLLDGLAVAGGPRLEDMTPEAARVSFEGLRALGGTTEVARVEDRTIAGPAGDLPLRVYWPTTPSGTPTPLLVWLHGGGWVIGDLESADPTARALCAGAGVVVVSVDYRLSPEHVAPAGLDDAAAALAWTSAHADELGADASRLAVGGDSAGGNLAALLALRTRDARARGEDAPRIAYQVLVYPVTDLTQSLPSHEENADGYFLTRAGMTWFIGHHLGRLDPKDPTVSPLHADSCADLPPALVVTAKYDPLRDEGEAYAARLREAGVAVEAVRYDGQIHGFFAMDAILDGARDAVAHAAAALADGARMIPRPGRIRRAVLVLALVAASGAGAACRRDQDPGIVPTQSTLEGATTRPPQLLQDCPPGGPDATTPPAGCVDEDGNVLH